MADRLPGAVFIAEDIDPRDFSWLTGTFSAHWEAPHGKGFRDGPEGVTADEAVAWGREQAEVVLIRLADSDVYQSAGTREPAFEAPPWQPGTAVRPRRRAGMEHLDLVVAEPVAWEVRLPRWVSRRRTDEDVERLRALLDGDAAATQVRIDVERGERVEAIVRFVVRARSHEDALQAVLALEDRTLDQVPFPIDELPADVQGAFVIHTGWDPMNDIRPVG
jgi:hypothetical protein